VQSRYISTAVSLLSKRQCIKLSLCEDPAVSNRTLVSGNLYSYDYRNKYVISLSEPCLHIVRVFVLNLVSGKIGAAIAESVHDHAVG
jgi:hypothetical protein